MACGTSSSTEWNKPHINSDRRLAGAWLQLLVLTVHSNYQRPWLFKFQDLPLHATNNHKVNHHLPQCLIMRHTTDQVFLVLTPSQLCLSRGNFDISELTRDFSIHPEELNTKSQIKLLLPAIPLGNRFELASEDLFCFPLFRDVVVVGRDLTRRSGCRTHRWPVKVGENWKIIDGHHWQHSPCQNTSRSWSRHEATVI